MFSPDARAIAASRLAVSRAPTTFPTASRLIVSSSRAGTQVGSARADPSVHSSPSSVASAPSPRASAIAPARRRAATAIRHLQGGARPLKPALADAKVRQPQRRRPPVGAVSALEAVDRGHQLLLGLVPAAEGDEDAPVMRPAGRATKSVQTTLRSTTANQSVARLRSSAISHALSSRQQISPSAKWSRTRPAVTAAIASSSMRMPSATRPLATRASPRSVSASSSRSTSPNRRAIDRAETASCSRSAGSPENGVPAALPNHALHTPRRLRARSTHVPSSPGPR